MASKQKPIEITAATAGDKRRRRRELALAVSMVALIGVLTWVELKYLGVNSFLFIALLNVNFILLLVVLLLVARNGVKLLLERRRNVLGARLKSRLVLAFMLLSLVPTLLMFFVSVKFVQTSVDYWFRSQVESSMDQALEVGRAFYDTARERMGMLAVSLRGKLEENNYQWGSRPMDLFLEAKRDEYSLDLVGALDRTHGPVSWHGDVEANQAWAAVRKQIDWLSLEEEPRYWSTLWAGPEADMVVGVLPMKNGHLVLGGVIGRGLSHRLNSIVTGVEEYKKLKTLKYPLKAALYFILGALTLLIVFGAMWFGFRLAKELTAPIQALAEGTERIARGDLSVRLSDRATDEFGVLVNSFNRMAEDLEHSQTSLTEKNLELGRRGRYMEAVLDNITAGVITMDARGAITTVNQAAAAILGIEAKRLIGHRPAQLLYGDYKEMLDELDEHLSKTPERLWQRQLDMRLAGEDKKLLVNVVTLIEPAAVAEGEDTENGPRRIGLVAVFEDITELEKMQRMAAWREVARRIAHEIKNPLTPIKLSAQRLERKFGPGVDDKAFSESTRLIVQQVEQLQNMVSEFSAFAKLPEVLLELEDPAPILHEAVELFTLSHSHIRWDLQLPAVELPRLRLDRGAFRRACVNILSNAAEALDAEAGSEGGETAIDGAGASGQNRERGEVRITVLHDERKGVVRIIFADNGPGLSAEERSRLFEPYFSRKKGGTGLGLTIVKSIISDHHGYVRAQDPGEGDTSTEIVVELPVP